MTTFLHSRSVGSGAKIDWRLLMGPLLLGGSQLPLSVCAGASGSGRGAVAKSAPRCDRGGSELTVRLQSCSA